MFIIVVIIPIIASALLLAVFFALYMSYFLAFYVPKKRDLDPLKIPDGEQYDAVKDKILSMIKEALNIPYEEVRIKSRDGLVLYAKYYSVADGAPLRIMFHGYRSMAERDFSGGIKEALDGGFNVLLVDQRAHGKSEGKTITFGIKERYDCLDWVNYAVRRFGREQKIFLCGISMGAATVLMASATEMPPGVIGIIADCGYTSPGAIIKKVLSDMKLPVRITYFFIRNGAKLFGKFDPDEYGADKAMPVCKVPVFFVHGEDDRFVPCEMTRENYRLCASEKTLITVPDAGHGLSYLLDEERYKAEVKKFIDDRLNASSSSAA